MVQKPSKEDLAKLLEKAKADTDKQLQGRIEEVMHIPEEEILGWFPKPSDKENLKKLMEVVRSSTKRNTKINQIVKNAESFAGVILTLLEKKFV